MDLYVIQFKVVHCNRGKIVPRLQHQSFGSFFVGLTMGNYYGMKGLPQDGATSSPMT